jgi:Spy/CpxP family protein refolding chaperone
MARHFAWVLAALLVGTPASANDRQGARQAQERSGQGDRQSRDSRQDSNRWKWWINPEHRKELDVTDEQSAQIDQIFESSMPPQRVKWREAEKLEATLSKVLKESEADVATVKEQVERLEKLQSERRAMRTVMLYRMNLVLTPEQRVKLEAFRKRREDNQRRQPDRRH